MRWIYGLLLLTCGFAWAQDSQLKADFKGEGARFQKSCGQFSPKSAMGCGQLLFTDHPLHIAVGSIAPQNGFAAGGAFVGHWTPGETLRTSFNADAVASMNDSWRAGGYAKLIFTPVETIHVDTSGTAKRSNLSVHPYTVFNLYAQGISLNKIYYYGLGQNSPKTAQSVFSMHQTIAGMSGIFPVQRSFNISLLGELNGRFISIAGNHHESAPSIEQRFNDGTAPGLSHQPSFLQLGEGVRLKPIFFNDRLQLDYLAQAQQFLGSHNSFHRFNLDLSNTVPLYRTSGSYGPKDTNGPDECAIGVGATKCVSASNNREGSVGIRFFLTESIPSSGNQVPFYLMPTLGGSDVNGNPWLSSYNDYRFRAPNAMVLRESFEHSIWGPVGFMFLADQGKVTLTRGDIGFDHVAHSFSTGLTLRAAGLPAVSLAISFGGSEGTHFIANVNNSLLGGSNRPSLF